MAITTSMIKELRDATSLGIADCKNALTETNGDFDGAIKILREKGAAVAAKRASKEAKEGVITAIVSANAQSAAMIEVNCETDFVTRNEIFQNFVVELTDKAMDIDGDVNEAVKDELTAKIAEIGENLVIRKSEKYVVDGTGAVASYIHMGGTVGVLVEFGLEKGATATAEEFKALGLDICLHVAAANPTSLDRSGIPANLVEDEKALFAK